LPHGRVLIEAGAAALPVAAYASGAVDEIVRQESTGLLVPPSNVAALGAVLRRLAADGALRQRLGRAGRERVRAEFEAGQTTRRIEAVLSAVLDGQRSGGTSPAA
jgi:glycosyltransferase involved in cell wall biosynthesis